MTGSTPPYGVPTLPGAAGGYVQPRTDTRAAPVDALSRRNPLAVLCAIGFVLLVLGLAYVWNGVQGARGDAATLAGLQGDVRALQGKLAALEQRPVVDLGPLEARVRAIEAKPAPDIQGAVAPLAARIDGLAGQQKSALDGLASQQKATLDGLAGQQKSTVDGLAAQQKAALDQLAAQQKTALDSFGGQQKAALDALDKRIAAAEQQSRALAERAGRAGLVQTAALALEAGQPLGAIPGAPPAVARFATEKPPSEASLRLAFPAAARAAEEASKPATEGQSVGSRMWQNAQALVTVREGGKVLVGAPAATALARAQALLDAGDLAGTVATLKTLDGAAAAAMANWTGQAQALLDARAGLAALSR